MEHQEQLRSYEKERLAFSTMMRKLAEEWETIVSTARDGRRIQKTKQKDKLNEIQKQERP